MKLSRRLKLTETQYYRNIMKSYLPENVGDTDCSNYKKFRNKINIKIETVAKILTCLDIHPESLSCFPPNMLDMCVGKGITKLKFKKSFIYFDNRNTKNPAYLTHEPPFFEKNECYISLDFIKRSYVNYCYCCEFEKFIIQQTNGIYVRYTKLEDSSFPICKNRKVKKYKRDFRNTILKNRRKVKDFTLPGVEV